MRWSLLRDGKTLVKPSAMGFRFAIANDYDKDAAELAAMRVSGVRRSKADTTWETSLYRRGKVRDSYNELVVELEEVEARAARIEIGGMSVAKHPRRMDIVFRAYDEGIAFRYAFPRQTAFDGFQIKDELTEWRFEPDTLAWTTTYAGERNSQEAPLSVSQRSVPGSQATRHVSTPVASSRRGLPPISRPLTVSRASLPLVMHKTLTLSPSSQFQLPEALMLGRWLRRLPSRPGRVKLRQVPM